MHPRRDLQEKPDQRNLIAHGVEEELLECVARLHPVLVFQMAQSGRKARVVFERR